MRHVYRILNPMIIKTIRTEYNLKDANQLRKFKNTLSLYARQGKFDELRKIQGQLNAAGQHRSATEDKLLAKLESLLPPEQAQAAPPPAAPPQPAPKTALWQHSGQHHFKGMLAALLADLRIYQGNTDLMVAYSAHIVNLYVHMATFTPPAPGIGAAQDRELRGGYVLQYLRSQGNHPTGKAFQGLALSGQREKSRLPIRKSMVAMLTSMYGEKSSPFAKVNSENGLSKPGQTKPGSYFSLSIAHAGGRVNNLSILQSATRVAATTRTKTGENGLNGMTLAKKLQQFFSPASPSSKVFPNFFADALKTIQNAGRKIPAAAPHPRMGRTLLTHRLNRAANLSQHQFKYLSLTGTMQNTTCLYIRCYPKFSDPSSTYQEGVTNALVSLFGGLLNHRLARAGMDLRVTRRQSFGFLRPTLTDVGDLTIRLSLGIEGDYFDPILMQALADLDQLLQAFPLDNQKHTQVKSLFAIHNPTEGKSRQYAYIRQAFSSDRMTLVAFQQAEAYLNQAYLTGKPDFLKRGTATYFKDYLVDRNVIEIPKLPRTGATKLVKLTQAPLSHRLLGTVMNQCLKALTDYSFQRDFPMPHSLWKTERKLLKLVTEARRMLDQWQALTPAEFDLQATMTIENLLEHLICLETLAYYQKQMCGLAIDPVKSLRQTEEVYAREVLNLKTQDMALYFTDSGQQAIIASLLIFSNPYEKAGVYLHDKHYFEVNDFFKDHQASCPIIKSKLSEAKIVLLDITQIAKFTPAKAKEMEVCIIDMTHSPDLAIHQLDLWVHALMGQGITLVFVSSALKHEQLGLDKYQSGRVLLIGNNIRTGDDEGLKYIRDHYEALSSQSMPAEMALYFNAVNEMMQVKIQEPVRAMARLGN